MLGALWGECQLHGEGPIVLARLQCMSNTLWVKLRLFGVNVVLVVPGAVRSNLGRANTDRVGNYDWKLYK